MLPTSRHAPPSHSRRRFSRAARGVLICAALLAACDEPAPERVSEAVIQLAFEGNLHNTAPLALVGEARDSQEGYAGGKTGAALETLGEGGWVEFRPAEPVVVRGSMEIAFDFKRADWINPYKAGSGTQTMVHLRGQAAERIVHLTFSVRPGSQAALVAFIEGSDGRKHRLRARDVPLTLGWHSARLAFDAQAKQVTLFLDDRRVDSVPATPAVYAAGIDRIKFGTWHEKNQAYKGLIDNFVLRDIGG